MRHKHGRREPFINLPPFTRNLLILLLVIQGGMELLSDPAQFWVMMHFGFVPAYYTGVIPFGWPALAGPVTFFFLHGGWAHVLMNGVMLMAFGAGLEPWMGWKRMVILLFLSNVAAMAVLLAFDPGSVDPVIGASGALSGLFAAAILMIEDHTHTGPRGRFGYLPLIALWVGVSVLTGVMGGPGGAMIAWPAHIGGFIAGLAFYRPVMRLKV